MKTHPDARPLRVDPAHATPELRRIRWDTVAGMIFSNAVAFFIVLAVAETLHRQGRTEIGTAAEAAEALKPLAGSHAAVLFSVGILGTGLLAVPILAGSSAFAVGEMFRWPLGLTEKPARAKSFYLVIAAGFLLGWAFCLAEINPVRALVWSAVLNGIIAVPLLAALMLMACSPKIMGPLPVRGGLRILGWITTTAMGLACAALLVSTLRG
jgi:Mn2+/Fe2+ NRAMP family transporter